MSGEWWHACDAFLADAWDELAGLGAEREAMWAGVELADRVELAEREAWGGHRPSASYAEWLAEGRMPGPAPDADRMVPLDDDEYRGD